MSLTVFHEPRRAGLRPREAVGVRIPRSLPAVGLSIGVSAVALVVFQPSATLAGASGAPGNRQPGSAGKTAAQVGARLLIDNLSAPSPSTPSAQGNATVGSVTIALASLHLHAPVPRRRPPRPPVVVAPVATAPVTTVPAPTAPATPATPTPVAPPAAPVAPAPVGPTSPSPTVWAELRRVRVGRQLHHRHRQRVTTGPINLPSRPGSGWATRASPTRLPPPSRTRRLQRLQAMDGWGPWPGLLGQARPLTRLAGPQAELLVQPVEGDLGREPDVVGLAMGRRPVLGGEHAPGSPGPRPRPTKASNWARGSAPSRSPIRASAGQRTDDTKPSSR